MYRFVEQKKTISLRLDRTSVALVHIDQRRLKLSGAPYDESPFGQATIPQSPAPYINAVTQLINTTRRYLCSATMLSLHR